MPEPGAARAPGNEHAAFAEVGGVRVLVAGDAWKGNPSNLGEVFTPVQVTVENKSGRPLRINYKEFSLKGASGFVYAAIPPLQAQGQVSQGPRKNMVGQILPAAYQAGGASTTQTQQRQVVVVPVPPRIHHQHFFVAPYFSYYYPGFAPWPYAFPYDPFYYDRYYAYWPQQLPTRDMLAEALPAGAIQNGGHVSGFVYFQGVGNRESRVTFEMDLMDASNDQVFGHVSIPFVVKK